MRCGYRLDGVAVEVFYGIVCEGVEVELFVAVAEVVIFRLAFILQDSALHQRMDGKAVAGESHAAFLGGAESVYHTPLLRGEGSECLAELHVAAEAFAVLFEYLGNSAEKEPAQIGSAPHPA